MKFDHMLIDGNNLLYRSHYGVRLTDSKGRFTSGVNGVMKSTSALIRQFKPKSVIVTWDKGECTERLALYPEYKKQRDYNRDPEETEQIERQKTICKNVFSRLQVKQITVKHVEADDVIGILCQKLHGKKLIVSGDQDFFQLVSDKVTVFNPTKDIVLNSDNVEQYLGFPVKYYLLYKCMVGDSSDNIKGIKGIGPVKAKAIIQNKIKTKKKTKLSEEEKDILDRNKYLMSIGTLVTDEQRKLIVKKYNKELGKKIDHNWIKAKFRSVGLKELFFNFYDWYSYFEGLKHGKNKSKKKN